MVTLKDFPQIEGEIDEMTKLLMAILAERPPENPRRERNRDDERDPDRESNKHKFKRIRDTLVKEVTREFNDLVANHELLVLCLRGF